MNGGSSTEYYGTTWRCPDGTDQSTIHANESLTIAIPVTNTGKLNGAEVIQVYVRKIDDTEGPIKTLRGFKRIDISTGKTKQVNIELSPSSFEFYDWTQRKMAVTPGEYEILYGNSSNPKDLKITKITIL